MGRAPCCDEKMGLKKGAWTAEEDKTLIAHIQKHGHPNWRKLPKLAGLLRCGKSCRLRWINYLNPDIKRGNFSKEEGEAIISLHELLGNRWSAIAARLPGRTDNEIKNVWHTQLKKRVVMKQNQDNSEDEQNSKTVTQFAESAMPSPPQSCSSDISSVTTTGENKNQCTEEKDEQIVDSLLDHFPEIDGSFWTNTLSETCSNITSDSGGAINEFQMDEDMDFWYNILLTTGGDSTLPLMMQKIRRPGSAADNLQIINKSQRTGAEAPLHSDA